MEALSGLKSAKNVAQLMCGKKTGTHSYKDRGWRKTTRCEDLIQIQEEIAELPMFEGGGEEFHKQLASRVKLQTFAEGSIIVEDGCIGSGMIIIRKGCAKIFVHGVFVQKNRDWQPLR